MGLFILSTSTATQHGVYAIKRTPTTQIRASGTGRLALVGSFLWGPTDQIIQPASIAELKQLVAPAGFTRTGYAYLLLLCMAFPDIVCVRVVGSSASKASKNLSDANPTNIAAITAKYVGTGINSASIVVSDATDADANHFNLTVTASSASGSTVDRIENINFSAVGTVTTFTAADGEKLQLVAPPVRSVAGRPVNGTYTFSTAGTDGTINSAAYIGTASSGNIGIALCETDSNIRHVLCDYPGSGAIAAVNAGLVAHRVLMGDRFVYVNGIPAQTAAQVQADALLYQAAGTIYADPWAYMRDDVTQAEQLVPPAIFAAGLAAQLSPSTSFAWKASEVRTALGAITRLETARGMAAPTNTAAGISTLIKAPAGGWVFEAAVNTISPADKTQTEPTTTGMDIYIAKAFVASVYGSVDSPNVDVNREDLRLALGGFMDGLKRNKDKDPNHMPHVVDFDIPPADSINTPADYAAGDVYIPLSVQYSNGMHRIFLVMKSGTDPLTVKAQ